MVADQCESATMSRQDRGGASLVYNLDIKAIKDRE